MADGQDIMLLLPEHLSIYILELLDAEDLYNCTKVSRAWNEMTDRLETTFWFEACLNAGIDVEEDAYHVASEWKAFFLSMVSRGYENFQNMDDGDDLMARLPEHLSICILEVLDAESLFNCTKVNRAWNEITDRLETTIWFEACLNVGIHVEEDKYQDAREWKAFFCSMVQRLRDMKISNCYEEFYFTFQQQPLAITCHNEKLAVAFSDHVVILDTSNHRQEYDAAFYCNSESSFLKFDGTTLVAASAFGGISCWSILLKHQFYEYIALDDLLISLDFLTEYSVVVGSILTDDCTGNIYIWRLFAEQICTIIILDKIIHKVLLAPNPDSPAGEHENKTCFLFGLAEDCVHVWTVEIRSQNFSVKMSPTFIIPNDPNIHGYVEDEPRYGFLFDGTELFMMTSSPERSPGIVWAWNFREKTVRYLESRHPIINLLGVGKKYLVYKIRNENEPEDTVCAVDKISNEIVARVRAPRNDFCSNQISLGHTSWMDGLNGENNSGVVFASFKNNPFEVGVITFLPRS